ncbi:hypothetical protein B0H10DRAFT_1947075 [Mycena sp. CBHHK59/15]|nr:hypothetical protein B0H10DRAFT_1947075 [Mycena sp. CBHHK59/15]
MPPRKPSTAEEIARLAAKMRVADPNHDNGSLSSLTTSDIMSWLMALGHINEIDPRMQSARNPKEQREIAIENLRVALWDMQRFDYLFPDSAYSKTPNFKISRLETWPKWKNPHPEVRTPGRGVQKVDGYKDAERLKSYVMTHFNILAFTQPELAAGHSMNPPAGPTGNWVGVRKIMGHAALDITAEGGRETPFVVYHQKDILLIMEILDIKRVSWPDPGPKFLKQLQESQEVKFGAPPATPLVPMMETPKIPLVVVRYSYMEGRPEGGSQFTLHLESRLREILPPGASDDDVRAELENRLCCGEEMAEGHIRMLARLLSHNSELVDKEWADDQQSHWNLAKEAKKEDSGLLTLMLLIAVEEIETGKAPIPFTQCGACGKEAKKTMCGSVIAARNAPKSTGRNIKPTANLEEISSDPSSLPADTLYVPVKAMIHWVADFGFANEQESVKMALHMPRRPGNAGKGQWDPHKGKTVFYERGGGTAFLYDRRRSVMAGYRQFALVVQKHGLQGQLLYMWTRRVGDCIEVDLKDIPDQSGIRWN